MIDDVRILLVALRTAPRTSDEQMSLAPLTAVPGVSLAIDGNGRPHLLIELEEPDADPPRSDVMTLEIRVRPLRLGGVTKPFLDVMCLFESVAEVFEHFIVAVGQRLSDGSTPLVAVEQVLQRWRQFLQPAGATLGRNKLASVLGELLVLRDLVLIDPQRRIDAWVGPTGQRHDFRRGLLALEVKTTLLHTGRVVSIHGEDQLEAPDGGRLLLHLVRVEHVPEGGVSVFDVVEEISARVSDHEALYEALGMAGVPAAELSGTEAVRFEVRERLSFEVDERMPRIVPQSFVAGSKPVGVGDVQYTVDLDHALDGALDPSAERRALEQLSGVSA